MSEQTGIPFFDWLARYSSVVATFLLAAIAGLVAIFNKYKKGVAATIQEVKDDVEEELKNIRADVRLHYTAQVLILSDVAVLKSEVLHTGERLKDINESILALSNTLGNVLLEIQKRNSR